MWTTLTTLVCLSVSGIAVDWDPPYTNINAHTGFVSSVAIYNDNSKYVTASHDFDLKIWDIKDHSLVATLTYSDDVKSTRLHPDTNQIFVVNESGVVSVVDPHSYS